jgi:hypothetical protein
VDHDYFEHALEDMAEEYREHHERKNIRHPLRIEVETGTHPWTLARARRRAHTRLRAPLTFFHSRLNKLLCVCTHRTQL